jgi:putative PIN family toxin of toxin-antitoxin system
MKLVFDTNVIFSAFATHGLANSIFEYCLQQHTIVLSDHILGELQKSFLKKLKMPQDKIQTVLSFLKEFCLIADSLKLKRNVCRDREDDKILGLAINAGADFIITGDKDLLVLKIFESIPILTPREFWEIARNKRNSSNRQKGGSA